MRRIEVGGVHLGVVDHGESTKPPLVMLHGFTGSAATWAPVAEGLAVRWRPIALELLGHGASDSPAEPEHYRMERAVLDVLALCDRLGVDRFALLGYSLGGRVALNTALAAPDRVQALVLESASPGIVHADERIARLASDEALAQLLEREGIEPFVDRWERVPLFASQARLPAEVRARLRAQRLAASPVGLANSLRGIGAAVPAPAHGARHALRMPTLLLVGALDTKYVGLGEMMAATIPRARLRLVPEAGHAVHLEQPGAFLDAVSTFLEEHVAVPLG